ncbi:MAG: 16S rRNA (adenine(1518)-N(6)/adenine(1519)-N(6))-dimethyltransferase RsmA [Nitriliruptoraceae bacterium]
MSGGRGSTDGDDRQDVADGGALLTPRTVTRLLAQHGLAPRKSAGQNFVVDPNTVRHIVAAAGLGADDEVLEIGPGLGSLTLGLAEVARSVTAIEIDAGFVGVLEELFAGRDDVVVVHADALSVDLDDVVGGRSVRAVANLPYNVATPLLFALLDARSVVDAYVMVQREVGERWQARVGDAPYSGVSLKLALLADVRIERSIPRTVFYPVPNVDSVMVRVTRRDDAPDPATYAELAALVDAAFSQRRKTLRNTLRTVAGPETLEAAAATADIDLGARAETLDVGAVRALAEALAGARP